MRKRRVIIRLKVIVPEIVRIQIEMRRRRVKIRVKIIVPEIVKIIVLETVPLQIEMPICSMYGIFTNICPKNHPNVGKYTIHGASGMRRRRVKIKVKITVLETVPLQIEMRRRMLKIRVKITVLEIVPLQIAMKRRRVKIRVKIIVLETVPLPIEMRRRRVNIRVQIFVLETVQGAGSKLGSKLSSWRPSRIELK